MNQINDLKMSMCDDMCYLKKVYANIVCVIIEQ